MVTINTNIARMTTKHDALLGRKQELNRFLAIIVVIY